MTYFIKHAYDMGVYQALSDCGLVKEAITQSPVVDQPTVQPQARYSYPLRSGVEDFHSRVADFKQPSIEDALTQYHKQQAISHRGSWLAQSLGLAPAPAPAQATTDSAPAFSATPRRVTKNPTGLAGRSTVSRLNAIPTPGDIWGEVTRFLGPRSMSDPSQGVRENTGRPATFSATPQRVTNRLATLSAPRAARSVAAPPAPAAPAAPVGNSFNTYSGLAQAYNKTRGDNARVSGQQLAGMYGNKMIRKNTTFDMSRLQTALATGKGPRPGLGALQGDVQNAGRAGSALPMFKRQAAPPPAVAVRTRATMEDREALQARRAPVGTPSGSEAGRAAVRRRRMERV